MKYFRCCCNCSKSDLQLICLALLSYIITDEESKLLAADRKPLVRLKMLLDDSLQSKLVQGGGHVVRASMTILLNATEILRATSNLLGISDVISDVFIDIDLIGTLEKLLGDEDTTTDEKIATVKCLWIISFRPAAAEKIKASAFICQSMSLDLFNLFLRIFPVNAFDYCQ